MIYDVIVHCFYFCIWHFRETTPVAAVEKEVEDVDAAAPKVAEDEVKEKAVENGTKTVDDAEAVATPAENGTIETPAADDAAAAAPAVADATEESKAADTTATEEKVTATETEHKNGTSTGKTFKKTVDYIFKVLKKNVQNFLKSEIYISSLATKKWNFCQIYRFDRIKSIACYSLVYIKYNSTKLHA